MPDFRITKRITILRTVTVRGAKDLAQAEEMMNDWALRAEEEIVSERYALVERRGDGEGDEFKAISLRKGVN
jgi:hypothetical protein